MTDHLSEDAIQQYALDGENCPAWMGEHLRTCERCSVRVNNYRLIFKEVGQLAPPVVGTDILEQVLMRASVGAPVRGKRDWSPGYWLTGAGLSMLAAGLSMLAAGWIFRNFLLSVTGDVPMLIVCILAGASLVIATIRALGMVVQYRRQLKNLDFS